MGGVETGLGLYPALLGQCRWKRRPGWSDSSLVVLWAPDQRCCMLADGIVRRGDEEATLGRSRVGIVGGLNLSGPREVDGKSRGRLLREAVGGLLITAVNSSLLTMQFCDGPPGTLAWTAGALVVIGLSMSLRAMLQMGR